MIILKILNHIAIFFIRIYQALSPNFFLGSCRFHPSCSHYAAEAFQMHGFFKGLFYTAYRLVRCQPFCKGGFDPVPDCKDANHQHQSFDNKKSLSFFTR